MSPETIAERRQAIRWSDKDLGKAAGLAENTVYRTLAGITRPMMDTADALTGALIAEELRLRDYLLALHPVATTELEKAS
jgi:transcriptional regulator with XRE-family HTH domain